MSASPAVMNARQAPLQARDEKVEVPMSWRIGQAVLTAVVALAAAYYWTKGWRSPAGENPAADSRTIFDLAGFAVLAGFIWLTTPTAGVIAATTFQEAVRRRWMTAMLAFALVILMLSTFFTFMQPGEEEKFLRDFGVGFIIIITLLMAIFLGVALVPPEIERRTIFTILSKPVNRADFLIGKYLGLCLTLFINLVLMTLMFMISYGRFAAAHDPHGLQGALQSNMTAQHPGLIFNLGNLCKAMVLQFGQLTIMAALALMLSLVVTNITAIVFCFLAYFGGQMSSYWEHLQQHGADDNHAGLSGPVVGAVKLVYLLLPRLDRFDVRERLVNDMPVAFNYVWKATGSGLIYVAVLLAIAYLVFSDREF